MGQFDLDKWASDAGKKWGEATEAAKSASDGYERKDAGTYVGRLVGAELEVQERDGKPEPRIAWRHIILEGNYAGDPHYHWSYLGGDRSLEFLAKTLQRYEVDPAEIKKFTIKNLKRILKELVEERPIVRLRLVDKPNPNDPDNPYQNTFINKRLRDKEEEYADSDDEEDEESDDEDDEEEDDEEEEAPKKGKGKGKPAPAKGKGKKSSDDEDEDDEDEDDEESDDDSDESDDEEDEDDEDDEDSDDSDDDDDDDDSEDDESGDEEDEEEESTLEVGMTIDFKNKGKSLTGVVTDTFPTDDPETSKVEVTVGKGKKAEKFKIKLAAITKIYAEDDDEDDEEEEEVKPKAKGKKNKK